MFRGTEHMFPYAGAPEGQAESTVRPVPNFLALDLMPNALLGRIVAVVPPLHATERRFTAARL